MDEFKALFGDSNRELVDDSAKHPILFGIEKRGQASLSDLHVLLAAMEVDVEFMNDLSNCIYNYEELADAMETTDRKMLLTWSDFRVVMKNGGFETRLPEMVADDVYGPVNITDLRLALIKLCTDYA